MGFDPPPTQRVRLCGVALRCSFPAQSDPLPIRPGGAPLKSKYLFAGKRIGHLFEPHPETHKLSSALRIRAADY